MKTCSQFEKDLPAWAAGETNAEHAPLAAHLRECAGCRARLVAEQRLFAKVDAGLMRIVAGEPSADFAAHVMAQVTGAAERALQRQMDAGLRTLVAGEPSPQFAAAVRARVAAQPPPRRVWFGWQWLAPAGVLAGAVLAIVFWPKAPAPGPPIHAKENNVAPTAATATGERPRAVTSESAGAANPPPRESNPSPALSHVATVPSLEVLIVPDERRAVAFYQTLYRQRAQAARLLGNRPETADLLGELQTATLVLRGAEVKTLDLVDSPRSTSDVQGKQ